MVRSKTFKASTNFSRASATSLPRLHRPKGFFPQVLDALLPPPLRLAAFSPSSTLASALSWHPTVVYTGDDMDTDWPMCDIEGVVDMDIDEEGSEVEMADGTTPPVGVAPTPLAASSIQLFTQNVLQLPPFSLPPFSLCVPLAPAASIFASRPSASLPFPFPRTPASIVPVATPSFSVPLSAPKTVLPFPLVPGPITAALPLPAEPLSTSVIAPFLPPPAKPRLAAILTPFLPPPAKPTPKLVMTAAIKPVSSPLPALPFPFHCTPTAAPVQDVISPNTTSSILPVPLTQVFEKSSFAGFEDDWDKTLVDCFSSIPVYAPLPVPFYVPRPLSVYERTPPPAYRMPSIFELREEQIASEPQLPPEVQEFLWQRWQAENSEEKAPKPVKRIRPTLPRMDNSSPWLLTDKDKRAHALNEKRKRGMDYDDDTACYTKDVEPKPTKRLKTILKAATMISTALVSTAVVTLAVSIPMVASAITNIVSLFRSGKEEDLDLDEREINEVQWMLCTPDSN